MPRMAGSRGTERPSTSQMSSLPSTSRMSSQPSASQSMNASQLPASQLLSQYKALESITAEEKEKMVTDVVQYLLVMDQKKFPIKRRDISKIFLKDHVKVFNAVMQEASQRLLMVFGFKVVELTDKFKGSYILINQVENNPEDIHLEWSEVDNVKMGLVSIVLSMIFMNGNVLEEDDLWHALKVFGLSQSENHGTFGDVKGLIMEEFVRQGYLEIKTQNTGDVVIKEFRWGQRATHEFTKANALKLVSDIYQCDPKLWLHQWQEVQEEAAMLGDGNEPMEV